MTVPSTVARADYLGDGATTLFPVPFPFLENDHVRLVHVDASGVETVWTEAVHYTLTGAGDSNGGTVTVATAPTDYTPAAGERLIVLRDVMADQQIDFVDNDALPAQTLENGFDKLTMLVQQAMEQLSRTFKLSVASQVDPILAAGADGSLLGWSGGQLANLALTVSAEALVFADGIGKSGEIVSVDLAASDPGLEFSAGQLRVKTDGVTIARAPGGLVALENLPRGALSGLGLANNVSDPDHDIDIGAGECRDDADAADIKLASGLTKRFDAPFDLGSGNGGMVAGDALPGDGTVHLFAIAKPDGTADVCGATSVSPTLPTGFVAKRRIASLITGAGANLVRFTQHGDLFRFHQSFADGGTTAGRNIAALALTVPAGVIVWPLLRCSVTKSGTASFGASILAPGTTSAAQIVVAEGNAAFDRQAAVVSAISTDTAGQVFWAVSGGNFAAVDVITHGYFDYREVA